LAFTALIMANIGLILSNRSWSDGLVRTLAARNTALWWVIPGALAMLAAVLLVPELRKLFHFSALPLRDIGICLAAGLASIVWFEVYKWWGRYRTVLTDGNRAPRTMAPRPTPSARNRRKAKYKGYKKYANR
jgi:Ca2+-transporting ATPase